MKRKGSISVCLVLLVSFGSGVLLSCSDDSDDQGAITIAWIPKEANNQVFEVGRVGAELRAKQLSQTTGREVKILYLAPKSAADIKAQQGMVQTAIDSKVNAIAISCSGTDVAKNVDTAVDGGIPTMSWDSDCIHSSGTKSKRFTYYGIDCLKTGKTVAQLTHAVLTKDGRAKPWRLGIFSGIPTSTNLQERVAGVWEQLRTYGACIYDSSVSGTPTLKECTTGTTEATATFYVYLDQPTKCQNKFNAKSCATVYATSESKAICAPELETMVKKDRGVSGDQDLDAVILIGLWPLFGYDKDSTKNLLPTWTTQMTKTSGGLKTVAYDTLPVQLEMAKAGLINALVGQKYYSWGYEVVKMVYDHLDKGTTYADFVDSGADVVCTTAGYDAMNSAWVSSDFTKALPKCDLVP